MTSEFANLLVKAATFREHWRDQQGVNAGVLDELADAVEAYEKALERWETKPEKVVLTGTQTEGSMGSIVSNDSPLPLLVARADGKREAFNPGDVTTLQLGDTLVQPPSRQPVSERELLAAMAHGASAMHGRADFLWIQRLPDGRALFLVPWSIGGLQVSIGALGSKFYADSWDYSADHYYAAWRAALTWDGLGEPEGWTRHPTTGRIRPDGTAASEVVER